MRMNRLMTNNTYYNNKKAHNTMQHTPTPPSLSYLVGQEKEHLANVELNSVATKEKEKEKIWLILKSIKCPW